MLMQDSVSLVVLNLEYTSTIESITPCSFKRTEAASFFLFENRFVILHLKKIHYLSQLSSHYSPKKQGRTTIFAQLIKIWSVRFVTLHIRKIHYLFQLSSHYSPKQWGRTTIFAQLIEIWSVRWLTEESVEISSRKHLIISPLSFQIWDT